MNHHTKPDRFRAWWVLASIVPLLFAGLVVLRYPAMRRFEFGTDEGIKLIKALLVQQGYPLYLEVWSDHPPLFTHALAALFSLFGADVEVARFFTLTLCCLLVFSCWRIVFLINGTLSAFIACGFVVLLPSFLRLGISVMNGLPALSLGALALAAVLSWHHNGSKTWLVLSAATLAASILTKAFTAILIPVFLIGLVIGEWTNDSRRDSTSRFAPLVLWSSILALALGLAALAWFPSDVLRQLMEPHLAGQSAPAWEHLSKFKHFRELPALMALAITGAALLIQKRNWRSLYLTGWLICSVPAVLLHHPVWYHHQPLVGIPAAMLAACAVAEAIRWIRAGAGFFGLQALQRGLVVVIGIGLIVVSIQLLPGFVRTAFVRDYRTEYPNDKSANTQAILELVERYAPQTRWMVTDRPIFAFRSGLLVPPSLAVLSRKRVVTGFLTPTEVKETIREYDPEQVLFTRFHWPEVMDSLQTRYLEFSFETGERLFIRKDLDYPVASGDGMTSPAKRSPRHQLPRFVPNVGLARSHLR